MDDVVVAAIALIVVVLSAVLFVWRRSASMGEVDPGLPRELRGVPIAFAETTFRSCRRRLVAKLDRAYRTPAGLQLVELKTRPRDIVCMSDLIELSVQRVALVDETGERVAADAWVIVQIHPVEYRALELHNLSEFDQRQYGSVLFVFYERR